MKELTPEEVIELQIFDTVHNWCDMQSLKIPDQNRRYLMDGILEIAKQYSESQVEREATIWKGIVEKLQQENSKLEENEAYLVEHGYKEGQKDCESQLEEEATIWKGIVEKLQQENARLKEEIAEIQTELADRVNDSHIVGNLQNQLKDAECAVSDLESELQNDR